jgi:hypothetical protein
VAPHLGLEPQHELIVKLRSGDNQVSALAVQAVVPVNACTDTRAGRNCNEPKARVPGSIRVAN